MKKNIYPKVWFVQAFLIISLLPACAKHNVITISKTTGSNVTINRDSAFVVPDSNRVVEGYLTLSQWYGYSYNDIDYSSVTDIDFSFMVPRSASDPTLVYQDSVNEAKNISYYPALTNKSFLGYGDKLIALAHASNVKVLIGIAGAANLKSILADSILRAQFVANIVHLLEQRGYDGMALDYEYPASYDEGHNILLLMQDLRIAFIKSGILSSKHILLTMAMPAGDWAGKYYDMSALSKCVDWFSPMTYEYGSNAIANINAPLYKNTGIGNSTATDDAVQYYLNARNVNPQQLTIGIPFYGWQYTNYTALGAAAHGIARATKDMYNDYISKGGFTEMWDSVSQHSYYVDRSTHMMIVYDNEKDMATKGAYLKSKGLKGAMVWELSRGFYNTGITKNPWLKALGNAVLK